MEGCFRGRQRRGGGGRDDDDDEEEEIGEDVEFPRDDDINININHESSSTNSPFNRHNYLERLGTHRRITYSITSYSPSNDYGPFHPTGHVNWSILNSISAIMDANVAFVSGRSDVFRGLRMEEEEEGEWRDVPFVDRRGLRDVVASEIRRGWRDGEDWAGVGGVWRGTYAFME